MLGRDDKSQSYVEGFQTLADELFISVSCLSVT